MKPTPGYASRPTSDDPRAVEAWALTEAARRLADASRDPSDFDTLRAALLLNQRLWTIFQAAMTEDDCPLPHELRTGIAALSLMVDRETTARLIDLDAGKLNRLIDINRNVAGGLAANPDAQGAESAAELARRLTAEEAVASAAPAPTPPRPAAQPDRGPQPPKAPGGFSISI